MAKGTSSGNYFKFAKNYNSETAITVALWLYSVGSASEESPISSWEGTNPAPQQFLLSKNTSNQLLVAVRDGSLRVTTAGAGTVLPLSQWVHVALRYSNIGSGGLALFINGSSVANAATGSGQDLNDVTQDIGYGARPAGNLPWSGSVAELSIHKRALQNAEIASLAKAMRADRIPGGLDLYIDSVRDMKDIKGGATISTIGTPTTEPHPRVY